MQTRLDQRVIEYAVVFAASDKGEPRHIREYGPGAILPVEPQQRAFVWKVVGPQIPTNGR